MALLSPDASADERLEGALLLSELARDLYLLRSVLVKVRGEDG